MKKIIIFGMLITLLLLVSCGNQEKELANCLTQKEVKMYGAFWCSHCAEQKQLFGSAFQNINYVECSLPDRSGQTQICKEKNITGYPTWELADGSRLEGVQPLGILAQRAGCAW